MALNADGSSNTSEFLLKAINQDRERIAELEATLREISVTYNETEQTPAKLSAALYAVCKLAEKVLHKPWKGK